MNEEKETMQIVSSAGGYLAPGVKVKEVINVSVLCASNEEVENGDTNGWFNEE